MIIKAFEIKKNNLNKYNLFLFYGENEGYKNEIIKNTFEKLLEKKTKRSFHRREISFQSRLEGKNRKMLPTVRIW